MNQNIEIKSKPGDDIIYQAKRHWSYGIIAKAWGILLLLGIPSTIGNGEFNLWSYLFLLIPTIITLLRHKNFRLYLTKQNVVYIDGAFSKKMRSIPISQVNDIMVEENFMFRDSGKIYLLTGNESAKAIKGVEHPGYFRDKLLDMINSRS